jgi:hypothetical protein
VPRFNVSRGVGLAYSGECLGYGLHNREFRVPFKAGEESSLVTISRRLCDPHSFIFYGYRVPVVSFRALKLLTRLYLAPKLRMHGQTTPFPLTPFLAWSLGAGVRIGIDWKYLDKNSVSFYVFIALLYRIT